MTNQAPVRMGEKKLQEAIINQVSSLHEQGNIKIPDGYNIGNAVKSAFLILAEVKDKNKKPALEVCSEVSVSRSMLKMVAQGLDPLLQQCYFVVYGNQLVLMRSYFGSMALAKRIANVKEVNAHPIYKDDEYVSELNLDNGRRKLVKHNSPFENRSKDIIGGFAIVVFQDGTTRLEEMTIQEIKNAWAMGYGEGDTHKKFPSEMVKKTVSNRALKVAINSAVENPNYDDDSDSMTKTQGEAALDAKKKDANSVDFDFAEEAEIVDDEPKELTNTPTEKVEAKKEPVPEKVKETPKQEEPSLGLKF